MMNPITIDHMEKTRFTRKECVQHLDDNVISVLCLEKIRFLETLGEGSAHPDRILLTFLILSFLIALFTAYRKNRHHQRNEKPKETSNHTKPKIELTSQIKTNRNDPFLDENLLSALLEREDNRNNNESLTLISKPPNQCPYQNDTPNETTLMKLK